jgi:inosine/xanthosine triphosphate pyrophosphatase family protein
VFIYPPLGLTFGELPSEAKQRVDHRGAAVRAVRPLLR